MWGNNMEDNKEREERMKAHAEALIENLHTSKIIEEIAHERKENFEKNKKEYIKKIFDAALPGEETVNVIFIANHNFDDSHDAIIEEALKHNVCQIVTFGIGLKDLGYYRKEYLGGFRNPAYALGYYEDEHGAYVKDVWTWYTKDEIAKRIPDFSKFNQNYNNCKTKVIYSYDDGLKFNEYDQKKYDELTDYYYSVLREKYPNFFRAISANLDDSLITVIPNNNWKDRLRVKDFSLWGMLNELVPSINSTEYKLELERIKEIEAKLQDMQIRNLYFYTDKGTDLKIGLNGLSRWISEPSVQGNNVQNTSRLYHVFPSYEIYTSPDAFTAEGQIVITKPNNIERINKATLLFEKGKIVKGRTDNEKWIDLVFDEKSGLSRIGKISLVPITTPLNKIDIAKNLESHHNLYLTHYKGRSDLISTGQFEETILDKNTGCHLTLGNASREATTLSTTGSREEMRKNNFNISDYQQDLIFGDDSIVVEAETKDKKKVLLMEHGKFKI